MERSRLGFYWHVSMHLMNHSGVFFKTFFKTNESFDDVDLCVVLDEIV